MDQHIQCKRLTKRNMKVEKSIRKKFLAQEMDVDFEDQRCQIPFILVKMSQIPDSEGVEHDGHSQIKLHSSSPIECIGDAQVLTQIFNETRPSADSNNLDYSMMRTYMNLPTAKSVIQTVQQARA